MERERGAFRMLVQEFEVTLDQRQPSLVAL